MTQADEITSEPFEWSDEQADARDAIGAWYDDRLGIGLAGAPVFRLFGYAGTGKTTCVPHIVKALGLDPDRDVLYGAYTGKAAHVLNTKGVPAETIHSLLYRVRERDRGYLQSLEDELAELTDGDAPQADVDRLVAAIGEEKARLRRPSFTLNPESPVRDVSLVVLDEVSMVDDRMAQDLMSFGTPLLVLGDPAQLPPVGGDGYFTAAAPDAMLTQIQRTKDLSPIDHIADTVRTSLAGDRTFGVVGMHGESGRVAGYSLSSLLAHSDGDAAVLCWRNAVRWNLINSIRSGLGFPWGVPVMGDKIIVLQNNRDLGVFNGQTFDVLGAWWDAKHDVYELAVEDGLGSLRMLDTFGCGFRGADGQRDAEDLGRRRRSSGIAVATFAQAMTVHKAQGSEWDRVLVVDESPSIWGMKLKTSGGDAALAHAEARRWLYTAITRASSVVTIAPNGR